MPAIISGQRLSDVIEIASRTDSWPRLTAKIDKYERDGARGRRPERLDIDAILDA